jgi:nucleotide-binding universal stress UspA family protein
MLVRPERCGRKGLEEAVIEFKRIVCPIDFSESSARSLAHAAALAGWYESQLTVVHVTPAFDPIHVQGELGVPVPVPNPIPRDEALTQMRRTLDSAGVRLDAHLTVETGDAAAAIVQQAVTTQADLIVMGTHGRRGFRRMLLGSVAETVLREAPCPVLTVPPRTRAASEKVVVFKRILCPLDFSPSALRALDLAVDLARQADGTVTVLHIVEWLAEEEPRVSAHFSIPEFRGHLIDDAKSRLHDLVSTQPRTWSEIEEVVVFGRAYREILRAAEAGAVDLIVMGAQGRGGLDLALFGSTTQQVVRSASCPVLTVRSNRELAE